jgi:hypothetical protein
VDVEGVLPRDNGSASVGPGSMALARWKVGPKGAPHIVCRGGDPLCTRLGWFRTVWLCFHWRLGC